MRMLSKQEQLGASDLRVVAVAVPEWGPDAGVYVRMLKAGERDEVERVLADLRESGEHMRDFRARACSVFISDEHGKPIYDEDDIPALTEKSGAVIDRIYDAGRLLNRMWLTKEEDAEKNSGPASGSSTGSQGT